MINVLKILVDQGIVSGSKTPELLEKQHQESRPMSQICVEQGIAAEDIAQSVATTLQIPYVESFEDVMLDETTATTIGLRKCYTEKFCPVIYYGSNYILMFSLDDEVLYGELRDTYNCTNFCVATPGVINACLERYVNPLLAEETSKELAGATLVQDVSMDMDTDGNKTVETLALIMKAAHNQRASDVLIVGEGQKAEVKFRIDGEYVSYTPMAVSGLMAIVNVLESKAGLPARAQAALRAGKIELNSTAQNFKAAIRFNFIPTKMGGSLNIRFLSDAKVIDYKNLGMSTLMQKRLESLENISQGLVLIVGPTGSGKSTTMLAYISNIIKKNVNICTVEDPVEAVIPGINQVDISDASSNAADPKTALTFNNVLKSFMRHDPDVIMVGEIRDLEVAETALQAADTGHLVISTIHTKDAVSSVSRLIGLGVKPYEICDSLVAVVAQRLVRRVCPKCARKYELPADHFYRKLFKLGDGTITLTNGERCTECNMTGYKGRMVISECMVLTSELKEAIELRKPSTELYRIVKEQGFVDMIADGVNKARAGETTLDELAKFAQDRNLEVL